MRKPTGQQLSEGAFFSRRGAGGRDGWNAPRTGRKAADIPKFRNGARTGNKQPYRPDAGRRTRADKFNPPILFRDMQNDNSSRD